MAKARRKTARRAKSRSSKDAVALLKADHREVEGWFAQAGLANAGSETIAPQAAGEKLTVKLWLATAKARSKKEAA